MCFENFSKRLKFLSNIFSTNFSCEVGVFYVMFVPPRTALARIHISSVEVAAQVWCIVVQAKHPLSAKETTALTEALAIYYALTVAANNKALTRRANKAIGQFLKDEELLKAVCQVSLSLYISIFIWVFRERERIVFCYKSN